jgi:hypothetical protein
MNTLSKFIILPSITCLLCIPAAAMAQTQLGADIDGEAIDDNLSAVALSADGNRLAAGAAANVGNGGLSGHVRVFEWSGSGWVQLGADIDGEAPEDRSGTAVSLSGDGNLVAIGAPGNAGNGEYAGHVRVFQWSGSAWEQMGPDIDGENAYDIFGESVAMSLYGNRMAATSTDTGQVRVYEWKGTEWRRLGWPIERKSWNDNIETVSLSASGDRVALGARGVATTPGEARVYEWTGTWTQLGSDIEGEALGDQFGASVSLSPDGNRLAVGAPHNDDGAPYAGHARVFEWNGSAWVQLGDDIDGDVTEAFNGHTVSLSSHGNRLAVGAPGGGGSNGLVRVYQWSGSAWSQIGTNIVGEMVSDGFGDRVALAANGNRVAASAPQNDGNGNDSGHARVFDLSMFNEFLINPGLNDAWYFPTTDGQGFFITVFPDFGRVSLAWFTYDTEQPPPGATANFGDPGHRWLTALGKYSGNQATTRITFASGGLFDTPDAVAPVTRVKDGTIVLTFDSCNSGTAEYDMPSLGLSGTVPIQRVVDDNVAFCEALLSQMSPW